MATASIRVRLTLWYGSALALILVLFAVALYAVMSRALQNQVDRELDEAAAVAIRALEQRRVGPFLTYESLELEFPQLATLNKFYQIFGPGGSVTIQSSNLAHLEIPLSRRALEVVSEGQVIFESVRVREEAPIRLLTVPVRQGGTLINILQVGTSLRPVDEMLHRLVVVLLISLPVSLGAALAGGWFLAGRAMRPVETITETAQRITAGDLSQRIRVPSPADELGRLASTFNDMIARLETSFRQIRQFSADASHELRTPLTVMKGETELALRRPRPLEDNLEEIDRMSQIVEELLFLSRTDLGEVKIAADPVQLDTIVKEAQRQAAVLGQGREIDVALVALGNMVYPSLAAAALLEREGISVAVVNARFIKPIDRELLVSIAHRCRRIVTVEEHVLAGGFGESVLALLEEERGTGRIPAVDVRRIGLPDQFVEHGAQRILREKLGLDAERIAASVLDFVKLGIVASPQNEDRAIRLGK